MLDALGTAGQMVLVILISITIISLIAPPVKRAIDTLENLPRRK